MSLWFLQGLASSSTSAAEANAPSIWSGGVTWGGSAPEKGYWQTTAAATDRTGEPAPSVAVGGLLVTGALRRASWQLGREQWLSSLTPASASLEFEGAVTFDPMAEVVIGAMSSVTDQHSDALWVGYVDDVVEDHDVPDRITTSVSCTDVVGLLGQARAPGGTWQGTLAEVVEGVTAECDVPLQVIDTGRGWDWPLIGTRTSGESALSFVNRAEQAVNAIMVLVGSGRLVARHRVAAPTSDMGTQATLDAAAGLAGWSVSRSPVNVVNWWGDPGYDTAAARASRVAYGMRSYEPDLSMQALDSWSDLIFSDVMTDLRPLLASASFHVTDLGQASLFLDPLDWAALDGDDWQVMSVAHSVEPGGRWDVSITADQTQVALFGLFGA